MLESTIYHAPPGPRFVAGAGVVVKTYWPGVRCAGVVVSEKDGTVTVRVTNGTSFDAHLVGQTVAFAVKDVVPCGWLTA